MALKAYNDRVRVLAQNERELVKHMLFMYRHGKRVSILGPDVLTHNVVRALKYLGVQYKLKLLPKYENTTKTYIKVTYIP